VPRQTGPERRHVSPRRVYRLHRLTSRGRRPPSATLLGGYVLAVCGREEAMARRPKSSKMSQLSPLNRPSGRPFLTETAPQTEFVLTHSKQTTEKFLTEARTHIKVFEFSPFTTQNLAQLIQRYRPKKFSQSAQVRRREPFLVSARPPLTLFAGWRNMAPNS
jgi:hypothetical protein